MRKLIFICLLGLFPLAMLAQKKQIQAAKDQLKSGKELQKVEKSMQLLLSDSAYSRNIKIWLLLCESLMKQYDQGNEKLYLKQKYDTASIFTLTKKMYDVMSSLDTLDYQLSGGNKEKLRFREKHAAYLNHIRPNLFNGGAFFIHRKDYAQAYSFFDNYVTSAHLPLFEGYYYNEKDALMPHAAYWSMYCGYKLRDADKIIKHMALAERDTAMMNFIREYEAEAFLLKKDTANYVKALKMGFEKYPNFIYFFPRLMDYYERIGQNDSALVVADKALKADSTSILFQYAKSTALLNLGKYNEAIRISKAIIEKAPNYVDAYYNVGLAYFNQAIELDKNWQRNKNRQNKIMVYYQKARPYMEKFRELSPQSRQKWLAPLYTIYLNLNMGKEFDEIDKIRNGK